jgi:hypothetical protein
MLKIAVIYLTKWDGYFGANRRQYLDFITAGRPGDEENCQFMRPALFRFFGGGAW